VRELTTKQRFSGVATATAAAPSPR